MQDYLFRHPRRAMQRKRRFLRYINKSFARALDKSNDLCDDISMYEMVVQEESLCYLDLALRQPIGCNWRKFAKTQATLVLPQGCREHLVSERQPPRCSKFTKFYSNVITENMERLETFGILRKLFLRDLFLQFEGMLFRNSYDQDIIERKWAVRKYLTAYGLFKIDRYAETFDFLIHLCTYPPLDSELTVHMLKTLCDSDIKRMCTVISLRNETCLENLLRHAADMRFDFWGLWKGIGDLSSEYNYIPCFISTGINSAFSRILLQYGFPYIADHEIYEKRCAILHLFTFEDRSIVNPLGSLNLRTKQNKDRMMLVMDTFTTFAYFQGSEHTADKLKTLVYLTRSLPDPFVTPAEVYHSLKDVVEPEFICELKRICYKYAATRALDGDYRVYQPRRLLHLSRCIVRKVLAENFKLLNGIKELEIPVELQAYLALES